MLLRQLMEYNALLLMRFHEKLFSTHAKNNQFDESCTDNFDFAKVLLQHAAAVLRVQRVNPLKSHFKTLETYLTVVPKR